MNLLINNFINIILLELLILTTGRTFRQIGHFLWPIDIFHEDRFKTSYVGWD